VSATRYIAKRALQAFFLLILGVLLAFFIFRLLPGDPTASMLDPRLDPEAKKAIIRRFGLDKPLHVQFILYIENLLKGNLGVSFAYTGVPVKDVVFGPRFINTIVLMGSAMLIATFLGPFLGLITGWKAGSLLDRLVTGTSYLLFSAPVFWIGMIELMYLGAKYGVIPVGGTHSPYLAHPTLWNRMVDYLHHMVGPLVVLVIYFTAGFFLYIRNTVVTYLGEDFIVTLRAKGLSERFILFKRIARLALIQVVTILAAYSGLLVSGAVLTETVFGWDGIGRLLYDSVLKADYPVLQAIFLATLVVVVAANFLADVAYMFLDPRIRYGERGG